MVVCEVVWKYHPRVPTSAIFGLESKSASTVNSTRPCCSSSIPNRPVQNTKCFMLSRRGLQPTSTHIPLNKLWCVWRDLRGGVSWDGRSLGFVRLVAWIRESRLGWRTETDTEWRQAKRRWEARPSRDRGRSSQLGGASDRPNSVCGVSMVSAGGRTLRPWSLKNAVGVDRGEGNAADLGRLVHSFALWQQFLQFRRLLTRCSFWLESFSMMLDCLECVPRFAYLANTLTFSLRRVYEIVMLGCLRWCCNHGRSGYRARYFGYRGSG